MGPGEVVVPIVNEDFGIEENQGQQGHQGGGEQPEPHAVVGHVRCGPSVLGVPAK